MNPVRTIPLLLNLEYLKQLNCGSFNYSKANGWFGGGYTTTYSSTVDKIIFATDTNTASVRGSLSIARYGLAAVSDNLANGWFGGGYNTTTTYVSTVDKIVFATDTNIAIVRGPLSIARNFLAAVSDGSANGWFGGGDTTTGVSTVDKIIFATDTNTASVRGSLSIARYGLAAVSDNLANGWFGGGYNTTTTYVSTVDKIVFATDTNIAIVRGPLSIARYALAAI